MPAEFRGERHSGGLLGSVLRGKRKPEEERASVFPLGQRHSRTPGLFLWLLAHSCYPAPRQSKGRGGRPLALPTTGYCLSQEAFSLHKRQQSPASLLDTRDIGNDREFTREPNFYFTSHILCLWAKAFFVRGAHCGYFSIPLWFLSTSLMRGVFVLGWF